MRTKIFIIVLAGLTILCGATNSSAVVESISIANVLNTVSPNPSNMYNLDHGKFYTWGINWAPQANEKIVSASFNINGIYNWQVEPNVLFINLLNNPENIQPFLPNNQVQTYSDGQGGGNNFLNWAGQHLLLDTYSDIDGPATQQNYSYAFTPDDLSSLNAYAADGIFGFGLDPDCHFYNQGMFFTFVPQVIPEPASMLLLTSGLITGIGLRKKLFFS